MVRLKDNAGKLVSTGDGDFNSSMVRLKVGIGIENKTNNKFQFQYGAIKRRTWENNGITNNRQFQFQYGAIKRNVFGREILQFLISIPVWCD